MRMSKWRSRTFDPVGYGEEEEEQEEEAMQDNICVYFNSRTMMITQR